MRGFYFFVCWNFLIFNNTLLFDMIELDAGYRRARPADAGVLAELVNIAGEGLPLYFWSSITGPGETGWDIGRARASRDSGAFSFRNAFLREEEHTPVACLIGYPLPGEPEKSDYSELHPIAVPLQQLEDMVPGTWYVNVLATCPSHRNKGYGGALLELAVQLANDSGRSGLSIIVSDANRGAKRLYERHGYCEYARRPMVKAGWENPGHEWVLLTRNT